MVRNGKKKTREKKEKERRKRRRRRKIGRGDVEVRSNSLCARRVHWRRVERRVELIIGRSGRIAALFPPLPTWNASKGEKGRRRQAIWT